ncbi:hypothetical protein DV738_g5227, partial [Chaetothyriales sp. CBS 135597]
MYNYCTTVINTSIMSNGIARLGPRVNVLSIISPVRIRARGLATSLNPRKATPTDDLGNKSLFSYTSGRYLYNETVRLEERHVEFDVEALHQAAEASLNHKHGKVIGMKKLAEGGFNRVFVLDFQTGFELIAKIPYRIAVPHYFATASEAATLTFLRLKGIPVPEVYAYSATVENPVRSEYILMEKAPGVCAATKWPELQEREIKRLAHGYVELEKALFQLPFSAIGSLYFKKDISAAQQAPLYEGKQEAEETRQFCIGPIADYMFWYGRRATLKLDRGPWKNHVDYLQSIAQKEIDWTQRYGTPMEPDFPHNAIGLGVQRPEDYCQLLASYKLLAPHLLPKDGTHPFNQPTLRHPDLTPGNIFLSPETGRISCLIDWQHTIIQPLLLAAGYPRAFENPDDEATRELVEPKLPENLHAMPADEQQAARELYRRRLLFYAYRVFNGHFNQPHIAAMRDPLLLGRQMLVDRAGRQWEGNIVPLKSTVVRAAQFWEHFPDVEEGLECPVHFDQAELDKFAEVEDVWLRMNVLMEQWRARICNMTEEGWVRNEDYLVAKQRLEELKEEVRLQCEGDDEDIQAFQTGWPFRDRKEIN